MKEEKGYSSGEGGLFTGYIKQRIKKNKNFMLCVTGPTGSGKTYSALKLAEKLDTNFDSSRVVFTPKEFMDLLNSDTLKKGSVIVADEFGVSMNSRNWQSVANQMINYVLQTFRSKNYIVIFTSPDFAFIDASARKLFHCHMMTQGINFKEKLCRTKPFMLQINQRNGDVYYKYLVIQMKGHGDKKLKEVNLGLPSKKLIKDYEKKKDNFVTELNKEIEEKLLKSNEDKSPKDLVVKERLRVLTKLEEKGITSNRAQAEFIGLNPSSLREWKKNNGWADNHSTGIN